MAHSSSGVPTPFKPPIIVSLAWDDVLRFSAQTGDVQIVMDGNAQAGPSPMQMLAASLGGCMAIDVVSILLKGRHALRGLSATLKALRAGGTPARLTDVELHYRIEGDVPGEAVERAIQLSRDRYCSVWHSLREDIAFTITFDVSA
jgi:putative redox protein